jgi:hypothetical protein
VIFNAFKRIAASCSEDEKTALFSKTAADFYRLDIPATTMDVDRAAALISAAGIELTDRRRNGSDDGWTLSFSNGAALEVGDNGDVSASGKGADAVADLLGLRGNPAGG